MLERFFSWLRRTKHGPIGAAVGFGSLLFGIGFTLLQAVGVPGSPEMFLGLMLVSTIAGSVVHGVLVTSQLRRLGNQKTSAPVPELGVRVEEALAQLPPSSSAVMRGIVEDFEETIRALHRQLDRSAIHTEPILIEGGPLDGSENILVDTVYIDRFPITNLQFGKFVEDNPDWTADRVIERYGIPYFLCEFRGTEAPQDRWDHPVVWISWYAAVAFCNWRSRMEGKSEVYHFHSETNVSIDPSKDGWRLPTEAEWEMAARAGEQGDHPWGDGISPLKTNYGNYYRGTTSVGRFPPNKFGVFDMLGNIKEWCQDSYSELSPSEESTWAAPRTSNFKVFRGASWIDPPTLVTFARRGKLPPENTNPDLGFRCVRRPPRF